MVQGVDVDLFRPDDELKKLAKLAVKLGVVDALKNGSVDEALAAVGRAPNGAQWLKAWKDAQDPWFNFTSGNGFYSTDKYWIEHLDIPLGYIRDYVVRLQRGEEIDRPTAAIAKERDRITSEYAEMLDRRRPGGVRGQARPRPHGLPLRRKPQFLHRALVDERVLAQDAPAQPHLP